MNKQLFGLLGVLLVINGIYLNFIGLILVGVIINGIGIGMLISTLIKWVKKDED